MGNLFAFIPGDTIYFHLPLYVMPSIFYIHCNTNSYNLDSLSQITASWVPVFMKCAGIWECLKKISSDRIQTLSLWIKSSRLYPWTMALPGIFYRVFRNGLQQDSNSCFFSYRTMQTQLKVIQKL